MATERYFIGIDLGTSNCALAYVDRTQSDGQTQVFSIPQYDGPDTISEFKVLPSFCYYLDNESNKEGADETEDWSRQIVVGHHARSQATEYADRTIISAKSWLCNGGVDRESKFLPWRSGQIVEQQKRSPVEASAAYLSYLRFAWDSVFAKANSSARFDRQEIVITVPASFDTVAQKLTLEAAKRAGYPASVRLVEEPQAAFYAWLEEHKEPEVALPGMVNSPQLILVCDVGGGTSDFSLFEIKYGETQPSIRRIAVSKHILLGGDNMDAALVRQLESQSPNNEFSLNERSQLLGQCRELKEQVLSSEGDANEVFKIGLAASGSSLFGNAQSISLTRSDIIKTLLDGFFPLCDARDKAQEAHGGLREMGLPYANDSAVTRHLAEFLRKRKVDAILFNGGTLAPQLIRDRLSDVISSWQDENVPVILNNRAMDLAVARGAAWSLASQAKASRMLIEGGSGHAFYLEVEHTKKLSKKQKKRGEIEKGQRFLVCVLPQGRTLEEATRVVSLDLSLLINQPINFHAFTSVSRPEDTVGKRVNLNERDFQALPILQTMAQLPFGVDAPSDGKVAVQLEAKLNSLGILQLSCLSVRRFNANIQRWDLEFNLRVKKAQNQANEQDVFNKDEDTGVSSKALEQACKCVEQWFNGAAPDKPLSLLNAIEAIVCESRKAWKPALLRALWEVLAGRLTKRSLSPEIEQAWMIAAGYFLRPGYGDSWDPYRMNRLWCLEEMGLAHANEKAVREQYFILWRRVSGGLLREQQASLFKKWHGLVFEDTKQSYEAARMLGAFEHLEPHQRKDLAKHFTECIKRRQDKFCDHAIWALGRLLNRVPLYGGENAILDANSVATAFEKLKSLDWCQKNLQTLPALFIQAARRVNNADHDVTGELRKAIINKLEQSGICKDRLKPLSEFCPVSEKEMNLLFGETLPVGLHLR